MLIQCKKYYLQYGDSLEKYSSDETEDLVFKPDLVVLPVSTQEVAHVLKVSERFHMPVTPRGAGTGLSGGALPIKGGIVLSLEKMNKILEIDEKNLVATVEPGVITEVFQNMVEALGLFYPPDPASRGSCFLGGNVAECSGGPRALKYGVTKDYVLGIEAVLPSGEIIRHGGKLFKNVTGYSLSQLLTGSEGTLAVVTKIIFKLLPLPKYRQILLVTFSSLEVAAQTVSDIFRAGFIPSACEFMEKDAIQASEKHLGIKLPYGNAEALLLIEVDGNRIDILEDDRNQIGELALSKGATDVIIAEDSEKQKEIWRVRRAIGEAVKSHSIYKEEDTVVPRYELPKLVCGVKETGAKYGLTTVCYGHAGDGNVHVNILKTDMTDQKWNCTLPQAIEEIFKLTISLGGTLSGEHGIGYSQKQYMPLAYSKSELELMKRIKKAFDPNGLLNPEKIFP
ncbi:MAG: FAD-binding protein [Deltaproteobacteria bacterium]|nr:FAD-binding protein [Deltaproteobacteria bacterium]